MSKRKFDESALMLAKTYDPKRILDWSGYTIEPKLDGIRLCAFMKPDPNNRRYWLVSFFSRNGRELEMFDHFMEELGEFAWRLCERSVDVNFTKGIFLDGEAVSATGRFADIAGAIHRKDYTAHDARFVCFHVMPIQCWIDGIDYVPQHVRRWLISEVLRVGKWKLIRSLKPRPVSSDEEVWKRYAKYRAGKAEGAMIKNSNQAWFAKRSFAWMKLKPEITVDVRITGLQEGKGKYKRKLGYLEFKHKGKLVTCGGMSDRQRDDWWKKPNSIIGKMMEVTCNEITEAGSLRFPRFKRLRPDRK